MLTALFYGGFSIHSNIVRFLDAMKAGYYFIADGYYGYNLSFS